VPINPALSIARRKLATLLYCARLELIVQPATRNKMQLPTGKYVYNSVGRAAAKSAD
jgi:hypothetical protein